MNMTWFRVSKIIKTIVNLEALHIYIYGWGKRKETPHQPLAADHHPPPLAVPCAEHRKARRKKNILNKLKIKASGTNNRDFRICKIHIYC